MTVAAIGIRTMFQDRLGKRLNASKGSANCEMIESQCAVLEGYLGVGSDLRGVPVNEDEGCEEVS